MGRKFQIALLVLIVFHVKQVVAQQFIGYTYNNYQTIGGAIFNPATIAGSRYKFDINVFSFSTFVENNAYRFEPAALLGGDQMEEDVNFFKLRDNQSRNLWVNTDILGPSFMVNLGQKGGAIGLSSRLRFISNTNNLSDDIFQLFGNPNPLNFDKLYKQDNLMFDGHAFADIGVTYARVLYQNSTHVLKGGVTAKYVIGVGSGSMRIDNLEVKVNRNISNISDAAEMVESLRGEMTVMYNQSADVAFNKNSSLNDIWNAKQSDHGYGVDLGLEYEWYPEGNRVYPDNDGSAWRANNLTQYKLKLGASVTDIGRVGYDVSSNSRVYTISGENFLSTVLETQPGETMEMFLNRLQSNGIISVKDGVGKYSVSLPTMLHVNADWQAYKRIFLNAGAMFNLVSDHSFGGRYAHHYFVTPRYETKWLSIFSPVSFNANKRLSWGMGFNLGVFFIGSGTVLSNLLTNRVEFADMYMGLHIPIFQKAKKPIVSTDEPPVSVN